MRWLLILIALVVGCADDPGAASDAGSEPARGERDAGPDIDGRVPDDRAPDDPLRDGRAVQPEGDATGAGSASEDAGSVASDGGVVPADTGVSTDPAADCVEDERRLLYDTPDPTRAFFNPNEVYLAGSLAPGSCLGEGVAPVGEPNRPLVGFPCYHSAWTIRASDRRLLYLDGDAGVVRVFSCDGCTYAHPQDRYPLQATDNDEPIPTPGCNSPEKVRYFLLSPDGLEIHRCENRWLDDRGQALALAGNPVQLGHEGWLLLDNGLYSLTTKASVALTGLPAGAKWLSTRATATGFWLAIALSEETNDPTELWQVGFDGAASRRGSFAAPPSVANISFLLSDMNALDSAGRLYQIARNNEVGFSDMIIRRSIEGQSEIVYDERTRPLLQLHISSLVTGPGAAIAETRVWGGELKQAKCKTRAELWTYEASQVTPPPKPTAVPVSSPAPGPGVQCRGTRCAPGQPCCEERPRSGQDAGTAECLLPDASIFGAQCSPFDISTACDQSSDCPGSADPVQPSVCCFTGRTSFPGDPPAPYGRVCTTASECAGSAFHGSSNVSTLYSGVIACQSDADCTLAGPNAHCVSDGVVTGPFGSWSHVGRCEGTVQPPDGTKLLASSIVCGEQTCSREDNRVCCHRGTHNQYGAGVLTMETPTCEQSCYESGSTTGRYAVPSACDEPADCADPLSSQAGDPFVCCFQQPSYGAVLGRECKPRTQCQIFACRTDADCVEAGQNFKCRPERTLTGAGKPRPEVRSCQDR